MNASTTKHNTEIKKSYRETPRCCCLMYWDMEISLMTRYIIKSWVIVYIMKSFSTSSLLSFFKKVHTGLLDWGYLWYLICKSSNPEIRLLSNPRLLDFFQPLVIKYCHLLAAPAHKQSSAPADVYFSSTCALCNCLLIICMIIIIVGWSYSSITAGKKFGFQCGWRNFHSQFISIVVMNPQN